MTPTRCPQRHHLHFQVLIKQKQKFHKIVVTFPWCERTWIFSLLSQRLWQGHVGVQSVKASGFGSGHDLTVLEFEPRVRLCADSSEPGACFRFGVSLSLCPSPIHALSLSVPKK